jgi:hypothetical protein
MFSRADSSGWTTSVCSTAAGQLPTGGYIDQSDGTSWMAMYALNLMRIALELAQHNHVYEDIATKFFEHFLHIAEAMKHIGGEAQTTASACGTRGPVLLRRAAPARWRHAAAQGALDGGPDPAVRRRDAGAGAARPPAGLQAPPRMVPEIPPGPCGAGVALESWKGRGHRRLLSLLRGHRMKRILKRMLDESEFLSPFGIRALSRVHAAAPYVYRHRGMDLSVRYQPAESDSGLFGGNSNWRGPIWFPVNFLIIESLQKFHHYYGDDFRIECPSGSGCFMSIREVANEIARRLTRIFLRNEHGLRPVHAQHPRTPAAVLRVFRWRPWSRRRCVAPDRMDGSGRTAADAALHARYWHLTGHDHAIPDATCAREAPVARSEGTPYWRKLR